MSRRIDHPGIDIFRSDSFSLADLFLPICFPLPDHNRCFLMAHRNRRLLNPREELDGDRVPEVFCSDRPRITRSVRPFEPKRDYPSIIQRANVEVWRRQTPIPHLVERHAQSREAVPRDCEWIVKMIGCLLSRRDQRAGRCGFLTLAHLAKRLDVVSKSPSLRLAGVSRGAHWSTIHPGGDSLIDIRDGGAALERIDRQIANLDRKTGVIQKTVSRIDFAFSVRAVARGTAKFLVDGPSCCDRSGSVSSLVRDLDRRLSI